MQDYRMNELSENGIYDGMSEEDYDNWYELERQHEDGNLQDDMQGMFEGRAYAYFLDALSD